jgi:hypothetical protein
MRRGRSVGTRRLRATAPAVAALAFMAAACAVPGTTSAGPVAATAASAATFVVKAATSTIKYPEADATLVPLQATATASGATLSATDAAGQAVTLVTAATAFADLKKFIRLDPANLAGPIVASLYSYYNSAYGQIQPDGSVKLTYQGTPVWVFTAPLINSDTYPIGSRPIGYSPTPMPTPTPRKGCHHIYITLAGSGELLTDWQRCPRDDPLSS